MEYNPPLDVESTIRGLTQDFCTAFNTGNYDQVAALFASDGVLMLSHRESSQGRKELSARCGSTAIWDTRICALKPRGWITRATWPSKLAVTPFRLTLGTEPSATAGKFLRAWRRLGAWRIVR